jgi:hypothetical protein
VIDLRFHEELYDGFAIDEAVKVYAPYATFTLSRERGGYVVQIQGHEGGADEAVIAAELSNYALGKTIEKSRAAATSDAAGAGAPSGEGSADAASAAEKNSPSPSTEAA